MTVLMILLSIAVSAATCHVALKLDNAYETAMPTVISALLSGIVQGCIQLWVLPAIGFFYPGPWMSLIIAGAIGAAIAFLSNRTILGVITPGFILVLLILIYVPTSCEMFHAKKYRSLIGSVQEKNFTEDIPPVKIEDIRLVSKSTAYVLANKVLGQTKEGTVLGSQLEIDTDSAAIQEVNGQLWWIFPLDFSGFFKWKNREFVPGYIRVNAQNPTKKAELIDADPATKKKFRLTYTRNAYFGNWLDRAVYWKYPRINHDEYTFEVDDEWRPYYVISAASPEIGFAGQQNRGVIIADPQTGKIELLAGNKIPAWVDRVKPLHQTINQVTYWGEYVHGWWNSFLGGKDIKVPTTFSYGKDMWFIIFKNRKYWFTGMTSASSKDQSLVGAIMVDTRTGRSTFYDINGTNENGVIEAVDAALGADSSRWSPTQPIPYNLYGIPTWVLPIVSNEGIYQKVALVDMNNISSIAIDGDIYRAVEKYREILSRHGATRNEAISDINGKQIIGPAKIIRMGDTVIGGNKTYYILIDGYENRLFSSSGETDQTRVITLARPGDSVTITFFPSNGQVVSIESIRVHGLKLR
ncbi:MAG TPA: hypothetical protein PL180_00870 [Spirochaetota bacterium]|nr:hypothetical protein [Spirochaetota bacterium]HQJ72002.1 hypothetical protein [Spirochaetota bacterium]HRS76724.1 hypothetical protein [Spirochaetota bacterium]HRT74177.1 hypothetical protein [Spirochaetota bacterium]